MKSFKFSRFIELHKINEKWEIDICRVDVRAKTKNIAKVTDKMSEKWFMKRESVENDEIRHCCPVKGCEIEGD